MIISVANHVCHAEFGASLLLRSLHSASKTPALRLCWCFVFKINLHRIQMWNASPHVLQNIINPEDLICCPGGGFKLQITLLSCNVPFQHHVPPSLNKTFSSLQFYSHFFLLYYCFIPTVSFHFSSLVL